MLRHKTVYRFQRSSSLWSGGENRGKLRQGLVYPPLYHRNFDCSTHFPLKTIWSSQPPSCLPPHVASFPSISETFWTELITPPALFLFPSPFSSPHLFPIWMAKPAPHTPSACNEKFPPRSLTPFSSTFPVISRSTERKDRVPITYCSPQLPLPSAADALFFPFGAPPLWLLGKSHAATPRTRSPFGCLQNTISGKRGKK